MRLRSWGWWRLTWVTLLYWGVILLGWSAWALYESSKIIDTFVPAHPESPSYGILSPVGVSWPLALMLIVVPPALLLYLRIRSRRSEA